MKRPVQRDKFDRRMDRIADMQKRGTLPPIIAINELWLVLWHYYGSRRAAAWHTLKHFVGSWWSQTVSAVRMFICDRVGWTRIYDIPQTSQYIAHQQRHGRKCSGSPNCDNMNCIWDSVPRWFKESSRAGAGTKTQRNQSDCAQI